MLNDLIALRNILQEDVISRTEYMKVLRNHEDELQIMKAEYEWVNHNDLIPFGFTSACFS